MPYTQKIPSPNIVRLCSRYALFCLACSARNVSVEAVSFMGTTKPTTKPAIKDKATGAPAHPHPSFESCRYGPALNNQRRHP